MWIRAETEVYTNSDPTCRVGIPAPMYQPSTVPLYMSVIELLKMQGDYECNSLEH